MRLVMGVQADEVVRLRPRRQRALEPNVRRWPLIQRKQLRLLDQMGFYILCDY